MVLALVVWENRDTFMIKNQQYCWFLLVLYNFVNEGNNNVILVMMKMTRGHMIRFLIIRFFYFFFQNAIYSIVN